MFKISSRFEPQKIANLLLLCFTVSCGFAQIEGLKPYLGKIQVPELFFVLSLFLLIGLWWQRGLRLSIFPYLSLDYFILAYLGINILMGVLTKNKSVAVECGRVMYLLGIYLFFNLFLPKNIEDLKKLVVNAFTILGTVHAVIGIIGWASWYFFDVQLTNGWSPHDKYLYGLEGLGRAAAFCAVPGMLVSILSMSFLIKFSEIYAHRHSYTIKKWEYTVLLLMLCAMILTFTRTIVIFAMLMLCLVLWFHKNWTSGQRWILKSLIAFLFCSNFIFTHIFIVKKEKANWAELSEVFTLNHPFASIGDYYLVETNYWVNKRCAVITGCRFFPWGVGLNQYEKYIEVLRSEGIFPSYFAEGYDPHCAYTGAFAELGIFGLIIVLAILSTATWYLYELYNFYKNTVHLWLIFGLAAALIWGMVDSLAADSFNYRTQWILFGIVAFLKRSKMRSNCNTQ